MSKCRLTPDGRHCDCEIAKNRGVCCHCYEPLQPTKKDMDGYLSTAYSTSSKNQWLSWDVETTSKWSTDILDKSTLDWARSLVPKPKKEAAPPVEDFCDDDGSLENVD